MDFIVKRAALVSLLLVAQASYGLTISHEPYTKPTILEKEFEPIVTYFSGRGFQEAAYFQTHNFKHFYSSVASHKIDIVFATVLHASIISQRYGYTPILIKDRDLKGVVIVPKSSRIKSVTELKGERIFSPFPSDPASYLGRSCLGAIPADIISVSGISEVITGVLKQKASAGFVADIDVLFMAKPLQSSFNILATSDQSAATYLLVSPKLKDNAAKIKSIFLDLNKDKAMELIADTHGFNQFLTLDQRAIEELSIHESEVGLVIDFLHLGIEKSSAIGL